MLARWQLNTVTLFKSYYRAGEISVMIHFHFLARSTDGLIQTNFTYDFINKFSRNKNSLCPLNSLSVLNFLQSRSADLDWEINRHTSILRNIRGTFGSAKVYTRNITQWNKRYSTKWYEDFVIDIPIRLGNWKVSLLV